MNKNSLILICGSSGLVGSAVTEKFRSEGYNNLLTPRSAELDLRDQKATYDFFAKKKPTHVVLAGAKVGGILANSLYPAEFIRDNLLIQTNTIDAAYKNECEKFCFLGSSCIYPKEAICPIKEDSLMTGKLEITNSAYATAKICGIEMINSYRRQYGFNGYSLMPTNLIGFNDNFTENSHVFPALIKKFYTAIKNKSPEITLYGTGIAKREFLNSKELAKVIFETMKMEKVPELMNVGVGKDITIKDLALLMKKVLCYDGSIVFDSTKPDGTLRKVLDISLMNSVGIETKSNLEQDIIDIYNWYSNNN